MTEQPTQPERWYNRGLQPERTALSWQRTGLAAAIVTLVLAFAAIRLDVPIIALPALVMAGATLVVAFLHFPRAQLPTDGRGEPGPVLSRMVAIVVITAILGCSVAAYSLSNLVL